MKKIGLIFLNYFFEMCLYPTFWNLLEIMLKECETALNVKFTQNLVLSGAEIDMKIYTFFDLMILKANQDIYIIHTHTQIQIIQT